MRPLSWLIIHQAPLILVLIKIILPWDLRLRASLLLNTTICSNLFILIFPHISCIFSHTRRDRVLWDIVVLILIQLWKLHFLIIISIIVRILILIIIVFILLLIRLVKRRLVYFFSAWWIRLVATVLSFLYFPDWLPKGLQRVVMLVLYLLDLFVEGVVLWNYIRKVLKHLRIFVIFVLSSFALNLFIFRSDLFNDLVLVSVLLWIYSKVFTLGFLLILQPDWRADVLDDVLFVVHIRDQTLYLMVFHVILDWNRIY